MLGTLLTVFAQHQGDAAASVVVGVLAIVCFRVIASLYLWFRSKRKQMKSTDKPGMDKPELEASLERKHNPFIGWQQHEVPEDNLRYEVMEGGG